MIKTSIVRIFLALVFITVVYEIYYKIVTYSFPLNQHRKEQLLQQGWLNAPADIYFITENNILTARDSKTGELRWKFKFKSAKAEKVFPILCKDKVFFNIQNSLFALDAKTGKQLWTFKGTNFAYYSPDISGDNIYFASAGGFFYALDINTGKQKWSFTAKNSLEYTFGARPGFDIEISSSIVPDKDSYDYYFQFAGLDSHTGKIKKLFQYSNPGKVDTIFGFDNQLVYRFNNALYWLDKDNYFFMDKIKYPAAQNFKTGNLAKEVIAFQGTIYFICTDISGKNFLLAIDEKSHQQKWKLNYLPVSFFTAGSKAFFWDKGFFYAIDYKTGKEIWKLKTEGLPTKIMMPKSNLLLIEVNSKNFYLLHTSNGKRVWQFNKTSSVYSALLTDDSLYFSTNDVANIFLYSIDLTEGKENWKSKISENEYIYSLSHNTNGDINLITSLEEPLNN